MSLAAMLRAALDGGADRRVELLAGDPRDDCDGVELATTAAAVLVAVVDRPQPTVILTVRTDTMRQHPGQISFPGGRIDPGDDGPVAAALREAEEEIALARGDVEIIGVADGYRTITGFQVTPVIGVVPPGLALDPRPGEVAAIFEAPLRHLLDPAQHRVRTMDWRGRARSYYEIEWDGRRIWGATAAMIVNLGRRLAPFA